MDHTQFKKVENKKFLELRAGISSELYSGMKLHSITKHLKKITDRHVILSTKKKSTLDALRLLRQKGLIEVEHSVYKHADLEYYGTSSLVVLPTTELTKEEVEEITQGTITDQIGNYFEVKYENDHVAGLQVKILEQHPLVKAVDYNLRSYRETPENEYRNYENADWPATVNFPPQDAYNVIKVPRISRKLGSAHIKIAVFDDGANLEHFDLRKPAMNQDHWDAIGNDFDPSPLNQDAHGTMCSGIAAGFRTRGNYGINGVGSGCSLVIYRIGFRGTALRGYGMEFKTSIFAIIKAFFRAAYCSPVDVISCSWVLKARFGTLDYLLEDISENGRGGLGLPIVFASGNECAPARFPANTKNVITVSAVDLLKKPIVCLGKDMKSSWGSNYGEHVDIAAVGTKLVTTDIMAEYGINTRIDKWQDFNYYHAFDGTSAAAPQVAGCIGLMLSINPKLKLAELKDILLQSTSEFSIAPKQNFGKGVLDVENTIFKTICNMKNQTNNYSTNLTCNPSHNFRKQFMFASQAYGTFYGIYGAFTTKSIIDESGNIDPDKAKIEKIDLELVNYSGLVNISLENAYVESCDNKTVDGKVKQDLKVIVVVKGVVLKEPETEFPLKDFSKIPDQEIYNNADFEMKRTLLSLNGQKWQDIDKSSKKVSAVGGIFDSEFFERNGKLTPILKKDYESEFEAELTRLSNQGGGLGDQKLGKWCIGTTSLISTN